MTNKEAIKILRMNMTKNPQKLWSIQLQQAMSLGIKALEKSDKLVKRGMWKPKSAWGCLYACSRCGFQEIGQPPYCSHCGALMKGDE